MRSYIVVGMYYSVQSLMWSIRSRTAAVVALFMSNYSAVEIAVYTVWITSALRIVHQSTAYSSYLLKLSPRKAYLVSTSLVMSIVQLTHENNLL